VTRRRYITAATIARIERRLSDRDRAIIETLDTLRVATTAQLKRLHFAELTDASAARQAPKALQRLAQLGALTMLDRRVGGVRAGSAATVWALDAAGQRIASEAGPAGGTRPRRPWTPSLPFIAHRLDISSLYVDLVEAHRNAACELILFEAEPLAWRRFAGPHGGSSNVKPDAAVRLGVADFERGFFIEVDRGTEALPTIARKCLAYRRYWEAGREQSRLGYFPRVVFSVMTAARKEALAEVIAHQPEESQLLFQVVRAEDLLGALLGGGS
jgi:hypothetical protein